MIWRVGIALTAAALGLGACSNGLGVDEVAEVNTATSAVDEVPSESTGLPGGTVPETPPSGPTTTDAAPAGSTDVDAAAANEALPSGSVLSFEAGEFDLDDDGDFTAGIVAPQGWDHSQFLGVTFEPPSDTDVGFFTQMRVDTGCDGMCAPTDWEERLTGSGGYLTQLRDNKTVQEETEVEGSEGVELVTTDAFGSMVTVLRWDDRADHYFKCEAQLDEDDDDLVDAFRAACEASAPGWFEVG
ncbi:MAG: hypothetical protein R2754_07345 [Microthrixaceae bacterium]